jgi:hypothetical protein
VRPALVARVAVEEEVVLVPGISIPVPHEDLGGPEREERFHVEDLLQLHEQHVVLGGERLHERGDLGRLARVLRVGLAVERVLPLGREVGERAFVEVAVAVVEPSFDVTRGDGLDVRVHAPVHAVDDDVGEAAARRERPRRIEDGVREAGAQVRGVLGDVVERELVEPVKLGVGIEVVEVELEARLHL